MPEIFSDEQIQKMNADPAFAEYRRQMHYEKNKWQRDNPELQAACNRKYIKTPKGKIACKRRGALRSQRHKVHKVSIEEKEMIRKFYRDRPKDYCVDHIIPLKKGGTHEMANLQYLGISDNSYKCAKIVTDLSLPPHCPVRWYRE